MLNVMAGVVIAVLSAGVSLSTSPQPSTPSSAPIRVLSSSHEVHFPDQVVFKLEAESESLIIEVTLFYRLARQDIEVYGYPEFTHATRVSADFTLKTSGANYLPSGVDIEYYYRIVDAHGNSLETRRFSLEFRDPRYEWQELRRGDLVVLWHDLPVRRVEGVAEEIEIRLKAVKDVLGLETVPPMKAVILNSSREARRVFPVISEAATRGHLYGGFAFRDFDLFVLAGLSVDGMVHEMTHLLVGEAVDSPLARVPAWLNEGLAMYFESDSQRQETTAARAARDGSLFKLRSMNTVPGRPEDVRLFYAQSRSVVQYMIDEYGAERMKALLRVINTGTPIEKAVKEVYGISLEDLEGQWRAGLFRTTTLAPRPDLGTVAVSFLIAGAILLALVVSLFRWISYRYGRSEPEQPEA